MYQILDTHTQQVVRTYTDRKRASKQAHRMDFEYGAVRFVVRFVETVKA